MTKVLSPVPDPVFAQAMVGPGTAVDPLREPGEAIAPVGGKLVKLHAHSFVILDGEGHGVLVHLGVETVQLRGEGFELLATEGHRVTAGQPIVRWNPAQIEAGGRSPICAVVALDADLEALSDVAESGEIEHGGALFTWR